MKTIPQIAKKYGISRQRLHKLASEGRIKGAKKVGGIWILQNKLEISEATRGPKLKIKEDCGSKNKITEPA